MTDIKVKECEVAVINRIFSGDFLSQGENLGHEIVNIFKVSHMNLLFPERFRISTETVFFDPEKNTIKIMFLPSEECKSLNKKIIEFIEEIKFIDITKGAEDYLDTLKSYLEHNPSLYNLKKSLVTYKREIVLCGIE